MVCTKDSCEEEYRPASGIKVPSPLVIEVEFKGKVMKFDMLGHGSHFSLRALKSKVCVYVPLSAGFFCFFFLRQLIL